MRNRNVGNLFVLYGMIVLRLLMKKMLFLHLILFLNSYIRIPVVFLFIVSSGWISISLSILCGPSFYIYSRFLKFKTALIFLIPERSFSSLSCIFSYEDFAEIVFCKCFYLDWLIPLKMTFVIVCYTAYRTTLDVVSHCYFWSGTTAKMMFFRKGENVFKHANEIFF